MTSRQNQAWFLIRHLQRQDFTVEPDGMAVKISSWWVARQPRDIDPEVLESIRCLKPEILLILRLEQRILLARLDDPTTRPRRKKWTYKRRSK